MERSQPGDPERTAALRDECTPESPEFARLLGHVHASLDAEQGLKGRLRALSTRVRSLLVTSAVALIVGGVLVFARRADFDAHPPWVLALNAATYAGLFALVSNLVLWPMHRRAASASWERVVVAASFFAPFGWAMAPPHLLSRVMATAGGGRDCLAVGIALGSALFVLFRALDRAPQTNVRSAALFAAGAGLLANLVLVFHCPRTRPLHLALVHAPIGLVLMFAFWGVLTLRPPGRCELSPCKGSRLDR